MLRVYLSFLTLFYCCFGVMPAVAASFDCAKASNFTEHSICDNGELSALDNELARLYKETVQNTTDASVLKQEQRDWLTTRNRCTDVDCIKIAYQQRMQIVQSGQTQQESLVTSQPEAETQEASTQNTVPEPITEPTQSMSESQESQTSVKTEPQNNVAVSPSKSPDVQQNENSQGLSSLQKKMIALALLINICFSIYWHHEGKLTIYADYTDASFTSLSPLLSFVLYIILVFFEVPDKTALTASLVFFSIMLIFVVKATYDNNGISIYALMALLTKLCVVGIYYILMIMLLTNGTQRKQGESQAAYDARRARDARRNKAMMAALTTFFVALSAWVCRKDEFTPLDKYIALKASATP